MKSVNVQDAVEKGKVFRALALENVEAIILQVQAYIIPCIHQKYLEQYLQSLSIFKIKHSNRKIMGKLHLTLSE